MKKILLTIAVTMLVTSAWAQSQLTTVRGKTKDGKTIKVEYYQGTVEDYVESVKYQLVDELQARVNELQGKPDAANKQIKDMKSGQSGNAEVKRLNSEIDELNNALDNLQNQLVASELNNDSLVAAINKYETKVDDLEKKLVLASSKPVGCSKSSPVIGVIGGVGPVFINDKLDEGWSRDFHWAKNVEVYFGTARMTKSFPFSIEAGLGLCTYKVSASSPACEITENIIDANGDNCQAIFNYSNRTESLSLLYLNIPIRACFISQPIKNNVSVYAKVGITPSVKMSSSFTGTGAYDLKGYYPQWDVTLENIPELGFGSGMECYADVEPDLNSFIVWGNIAAGVYVPLGKLPLMLNAGVGLDISFLGTIIPSLDLGLVIIL